MLKKILIIAYKDVYIRFSDITGLLFMLIAPLAISLIIGVTFGGHFSDLSFENNIPIVIINADEGVSISTGPGGEDMELNYGDILINVLTSEGMSEVLAVDLLTDEGEARELVEKGDATVAVFIPADFSQRVQWDADGLISAPTGEITSRVLSLYINSGSQTSGLIVEGIVRGVANSFAVGDIMQAVDMSAAIARATSEGASSFANIGSALQIIRGATQSEIEQLISLAEESVTGEESDEFSAISFFAPGMAIFFMMFTTSFGATEILEEQRNGTLQRMLIAPINPNAVLLGKMLSVFLTALLQLIILIIATGLFGASWGTDLLAVVLVLFATVTAGAGVGTFIASLAKDPRQVQTYGSALLTVMGMLGGSFFPLPEGGFLLAIAKLTPNWWGISAFQNLARGDGLNDVALNLVVLFVMGTVFFTIGGWLFGRRLQP